MKCSTLRPLFLFFILLFSTCTTPAQIQDGNREGSEVSHFPTTRIAAEWEPALGTLLVWPLSIPHKLVVELANDAKLYTLVPDEAAQREATKWFQEWDIDLATIDFIVAPQGVDASWVRDWGPHAIFTTDGAMKLGDGRYQNSTPITNQGCSDPLRFLFTTENGEIIPTTKDDEAPNYIAEHLGLEVLPLPFVFTGGNVMADGLGTVLSTCVITNENNFEGVTEEQFLNNAQNLIGADRYHIISNFETRGIQHIDCFLKLLDEERILVARPPKDHELYPIYEDIVQNELAKLETIYGRPYQILRIDTDRYRGDRLAAYTNSLIINQTVYVPLFGIEQDSVALSQWQQALPGYTIKGFEFVLEEEPILSEFTRRHYQGIGWNDGDALHCRTRAVWDPDMLYISVRRLDPLVQKANNYPVWMQVFDYSDKGLKRDDLKLYWRKKGNDTWNSTLLKEATKSNQFMAAIPSAKVGDTIEYYVAAESHSGRRETMPRSAPLGFYQFKIVD